MKQTLGSVGVPPANGSDDRLSKPRHKMPQDVELLDGSVSENIAHFEDFQGLLTKGYTEKQKVRELERKLAGSESERGALLTDLAVDRVANQRNPTQGPATDQGIPARGSERVSIQSPLL